MPKASRDSIIAKKTREKSVVAKQEEVRAKQEAFANAILEGASDSDAARAAGYHPATAKNVMRQEDVQLHLANARQEIADTTTIRRLDVLNVFLDAIEMARTLADPANMINGADKVAKMMGYYEPEKIDVRVTHDTAVFHSKLKQLTDSELMELASGNHRVIEGETLT